jgi:hypothetical protein
MSLSAAEGQRQDKAQLERSDIPDGLSESGTTTSNHKAEGIAGKTSLPKAGSHHLRW